MKTKTMHRPCVRRARLWCVGGVVALMTGVVCTAAADPPCELHETQKLAWTGADELQEFGSSTSMTETMVAVGAPNTMWWTGAVHVFQYDGEAWTEEAKLTASDGAPLSRFGRSVALHDIRLIVGATGDYDPVEHPGAAYVFRRDARGWTEEAKLTPSDGAADDHYGTSAALAGDLAMVGALRHDGIGDNAGAVYAYQRSGSSWHEVQKLTGSDAAPGMNFGRSVAIDGLIAAIGAPAYDSETLGGRVYVFTDEGASGWTEHALLTPPNGQVGDGFGRAIAMQDDVFLIGAKGEAHVYRHNGSEWTWETTLQPWDEAGSVFASAVALNGSYALVGSHNAGSSGQAYLYRDTGMKWEDAVLLSPSDGVGYDDFGFSVAISGVTAIVGAKSADDFAGAGYVFADVEDCEPYLGEYDVIDLGTLGGQYSYAYAVNNAGQVVGRSGGDIDPDRAFLWEDGEMIDLGAVPGYSESVAIDINDSGQIVGRSTQSGDGSRATLWQDGQIIDIGPLTGTSSGALDINESGQVLCRDDGGAFIYDAGDKYYIDEGPGDAQLVTDDLVVVGTVYDDVYMCGKIDTYLYEQGETTMLWEPVGDAHFIPAAVSPDQTVVGHEKSGWYMDCAAYYQNAWKWDATSGEGEWLPNPKVHFTAHEACGINTRGDIVGSSFDDFFGGGLIATRWRDDGGVDLNDLIADASEWKLERANDVNDTGQIVGYGYLPYTYKRAFLLTPRTVPGDIDGDGDVDVVDLLALLGAWGPCPDCPEDLNGDGTVDVLDLLLLLGNWT